MTRGEETTDRGPAKGFDEGRIFRNSRNEVEVSVTGISRKLKKSSKIPGGGSGPS